VNPIQPEEEEDADQQEKSIPSDSSHGPNDKSMKQSVRHCPNIFQLNSHKGTSPQRGQSLIKTKSRKGGRKEKKEKGSTKERRKLCNC
jgi:hypothetical protein